MLKDSDFDFIERKPSRLLNRQTIPSRIALSEYFVNYLYRLTLPVEKRNYAKVFSLYLGNLQALRRDARGREGHPIGNYITRSRERWKDNIRDSLKYLEKIVKDL